MKNFICDVNFEGWMEVSETIILLKSEINSKKANPIKHDVKLMEVE